MSDTTPATTINIDLTDLDSIAAAVQSGITTIEQVADYLGIDLIEDCLVLDGTPFTAAESGCEIECDGADSTEEAAQQYVDGGDWGDRKETTWVHVSVWQAGLDEDGEEHVWKEPHSILGGLKENPGCWGNGGGIIQHSVCMRCGCKRTYDSWATDPSNGTQGHSSTSFEEGAYTDEVAAAHLEEAIDDLDAEESDGDYTYEVDGIEYIADRDQMIEYGRAMLCGDAADLPGSEVEADDDE